MPPIVGPQGGQLGGNTLTDWQRFKKGLAEFAGNISFTSGANGYSFSTSGGGTNMLPNPPSTRDINTWLPYVIGGVVLLKLLK
tara:strand:+ start:306 stop:554 length:249 start_codon:yes stop_codon:yes gene_type:complete